MSLEIIIDGYNLINAWKDLKIKFKQYPEIARDELIDILSNYRKIKKHKITVVFDAYNIYNLLPSKFSEKGINIIFTPLNITADQYIKNRVKNNGEKYIVVSSDNEIKDFSKLHKATPVDSEDFIFKLEFAFYADLKGVFKDEVDYNKSLSTKKKGNPKKLPKKIRKLKQKIDKL